MGGHIYVQGPYKNLYLFIINDHINIWNDNKYKGMQPYDNLTGKIYNDRVILCISLSVIYNTR